MKTKAMAEINLKSNVLGVRPNGAGSKSPTQIKSVCLSAVRRSAHVAAKEPPNEKGLIQPLGMPRSYRRKNSANQIPANEEARMYAIRRAEELQTELGSGFPSLVKSMNHSHVKGSFFLNFPVSFCKSYLPKHDERITLLDEDGKEYATKYLMQQHALSGGWIRFAKDHKLVDGDALVFQVIQPTKFKAYIVRANDLATGECLNPFNIDVHARETDFNKNRGTDAAANEMCPSHLLPAVLQGNANESNPLRMNSNIQHRSNPSVEERRHMHSSDTEDFTLSGCIPDFENFRIIVNGKSVDHEFSEQVRANYYNLCCSRKSYLHKHLRKSISSAKAVGVITRTLDMANAVRASKLSSSTNDFEMWEKSLVAVERMGMEVGFIRDRLKRLVSLVSESRVTEEMKRYGEAKSKRDRTEEEIMSLDLNLMKLKYTKERIEDEMVAIRVNLHGYEMKFQEEASAPW